MEEHLATIALSIAGPAILAIFAFLWKQSHKVTELDNRINALRREVQANRTQLDKHFDKTFTIRRNVPKEFQ